MRFSRLASDEQKLGRSFLCAGRWHRERCGQNGSVKSATLEEQINRDLMVRAPSCSPRPLGRLTPGPIGFIFCLANAFVFTAIVAPFLKGEQSYSDLVGSTIAWGNVDKGFDFRVFQV